MTAAVSGDLPKSGLFAFASARLLKQLGSIATLQHFDAGTEVFAQGDPGDAMYFIDHGRLEVSVISPDGRKLSLDILKDGDVLGEIALLDEGLRTATITAKTHSRLWRLSRRDLKAAIADDPELSMELLVLAGKRLRWLSRQIHEQAFLSLQERLAAKILHLTSESDDEGMNTLYMSQSELADFLAVTREAVSKTLTSWKQSGAVELGRGKLIILDRDALRMMAGVHFF